MQFNWTSHVIGRRFAIRVLALTSIVMAPAALFAQPSDSPPRAITEGSLGAALLYWDDFHVFGTAFGGSARLYVTPRIAVGAEINSVLPTESFTDSQLIVLGIGSIDLRPGLSAPFVTIGGGVMHRYSNDSTVADPNSGVLIGGVGWRLASKAASRGWYIAPEFRAVIFDDVSWQPRVNVGYRF